MGAFADLRGVRLHYETAGAEGPPLVFIHGAMGGAFVFAPYLAAFQDRYRVFAIDMRGRGRSPDTEGPFGFDDQAGDVVAFIDDVIGEPVHYVGYSDGGIIGLVIGVRHPGRMSSLTTIGANFHHDGLEDGSFFDHGPDDPSFEMPRTMHQQLSPDGPEHWPVIFEKVMATARVEPTLTVDDLATIDVPALVMCADHDIISLEHTTSLYRSLPNGQLAVIPDSTHAVGFERPDVVQYLIAQFIERL